MNRLLLLLVFALALPCHGQMLQAIVGQSSFSPAACTTPAGANFTESFGDSATSCWAGGPETCNHTWLVNSGSPESIISSPAGAPANSACDHSLQYSISGTNNWIKTGFTGIASSTAYDVTITFYLSSSSIATGNQDTVLCITAGGNCSTSTMVVGMFVYGDYVAGHGQPALRGYGSTGSSNILINLNTWYTVVLHHDPTAANCSIAVDGGTPATFTCNIATSSEFFVGNPNYGNDNITYVIGSIKF